MFAKILHNLKKQKYQSLLTHVIELGLVCHGLSIYSTLENKMREENYFSDQPEAEKAKTYSRIFTLMLVYNAVHKIIIGFIQDLFGMWIARTLIHIQMITALIILIIMNAEKDFLAFIGFPMYYGAAIGLAVNFVQITFLDLKRKSLWNSTTGSIIVVGQQMYLFYRALSDTNYFWYMLLVFQVPVIFRTFYYTSKSNTVAGGIGWGTRKLPLPIFDDSKKENKGQGDKSKISKTCQKLFSVALLCIMVHSILNELRIQAFADQLQSWLIWATDNDQEKINYYTDFYVSLSLISLVTSLIQGFLMDSMINFFHTNKKFNLNKKYASILASSLFLCLCSLCHMMASFMLIFKLVDSETGQPTSGWNYYLALIFRTLGINCYYTPTTVLIMAISDPNYVSRVFALKNLAGLVELLLPTLITFVNETCEGNFATLEKIFVVAGLVSMIFPVLVIFYQFRFGGEEFRNVENEKIEEDNDAFQEDKDDDERFRAESIMSHIY